MVRKLRKERMIGVVTMRQRGQYRSINMKKKNSRSECRKDIQEDLLSERFPHNKEQDMQHVYQLLELWEKECNNLKYLTTKEDKNLLEDFLIHARRKATISSLSKCIDQLREIIKR